LPPAVPRYNCSAPLSASHWHPQRPDLSDPLLPGHSAVSHKPCHTPPASRSVRQGRRHSPPEPGRLPLPCPPVPFPPGQVSPCPRECHKRSERSKHSSAPDQEPAFSD